MKIRTKNFKSLRVILYSTFNSSYQIQNTVFQTNMAQYPIPQFIEAEGKMVSFLTFKQFFWIVGGGALCVGFYYFLPFWLFVILSLLVAGFVALVAFIKIDNVPVTTMILNVIMFSTKSKDYVWKKKHSAYPFKTKNMQDLSQQHPAGNKIHSVKNMIEYRKKQ